MVSEKKELISVKLKITFNLTIKLSMIYVDEVKVALILMRVKGLCDRIALFRRQS